MSDEPTPRPTPDNRGPENAENQNAKPNGDTPKKRRRRRRRGKNKANQAEGAAPEAQAAAPNSGSETGNESQRPAKSKKMKSVRSGGSGQGYRGKNDGGPEGKKSRGTQRGRDDQGDREKSGGPKSGRGSSPDRSGSKAGPPEKKKKKKRRKPRTKQCVNCYTPCTTIHRVRLDHRKQWVFICDICWPSRCVDNPHYEFGGTWVTGRIVKPESQLRDEARAKQKDKKQSKDIPPRPAHADEDQTPHQPESAEADTLADQTTAVIESPESSAPVGNPGTHAQATPPPSPQESEDATPKDSPASE